MKSRPAATIASVMLTLSLTLGSGLAASAAAPAAPVQPTRSAGAATTPDVRATWRPYDYAKITSKTNCEARRSWLVANVSWITRSTSRCQSVVVGTCPSTYTRWMVMVLTSGRAWAVSLEHKDPSLGQARC